jgi:hypothetical protein
LIFPANAGDPTVVNFLKCLLKKKENERICNLEQLKLCEVFENFPWVIFNILLLE